MPTAAASGTFAIAGELEVNRLGFGAMRLTGPGSPARPPTSTTRRAVLRRARRARRQPHRHRRRVRPGRQRGADRRGAASVPGRPRHRDEGRPRARRGRGGEWPKDGRPEHLREACEGEPAPAAASSAIDVYYLHRPDPEVPYEESVGALKELKDEGKIRHVAVSNVERRSCWRSPAASSTSPSSRTSTASPTAARRTCSTPARRRGIGFVPWAPLDAGALDPAGPVAEIARHHEATPPQIAPRVAAAHVAGDAADPGDVVARRTSRRTSRRRRSSSPPTSSPPSTRWAAEAAARG